MNYSGISYPDVENGKGVRCTLFVSGCSHHCKGCHNPETWNFDFGSEFTKDTKDKLFNIVAKTYIHGLTLSGGDPLDNYDDILSLVKEFRVIFGETKNIWLYTGYQIEQLESLGKTEILDYVDVIVDGEYHENERDITLAFRGSKNQRILYKGIDF
jgi:anaerobic ribonucleoside-triphosphate reductase activating protein